MNFLEANIVKIENGFLVTITKTGNQSLIDKTKSYIAKDMKEVFKLLRENI